MQYIIDAGADLNRQDEHGYTALHLAIVYGQEEAIDLLLDNGARTDLRNKNNRDAYAEMNFRNKTAPDPISPLGHVMERLRLLR
ncbi:ankyrin repeat domain-containing protein [Parasedimentitalea huanghaiensis]|uniref:ankyrin repeat domain-containing protein n=1 Tax=Parasedimentitalea huanghaiensis TaxID=2682100 RepID=UPI003CC91B39